MTREEYINFANCLKNNYTIDFDVLPEFCDMAISAVKWIPVSERLPEIGQRVIVTYETFDEGLQVRETIYDKYGFLCGHGIAWQPLPEPYKGGDV